MKTVVNDLVLFSIIVPIYKVEDCLRRCVESIIRQTYRDFEVLLIDDGSPDNCPAICDEYSARDPRIRVIHKQNGGLVSARNTGIQNAKGKYICYVDGDDWVEENLLEVLQELIMQENEPEMIIYNAYIDYPDRTEKLPEYVECGYYDKERLRQEIYPRMIYDPSLPFFTGSVFPAAWNKVYRRELLEQHYCRDERIGLAEDNAFTFECLYHAGAVFFCKDTLYHYNRCNEGSMISKYNESFFQKSQLVCRYIEQNLAGKEDCLDSQISVFHAAWVIMAVFHEVRYQPFGVAGKNISRKIGRSGELARIRFRKLPFLARGYLVMLRLHLYFLAEVCARIWVKYGEKR